MGDLNPEFIGTWRSDLNPWYGYLKINPDGTCIAIKHAHHGKDPNEPVSWWCGKWHPTDMGWEVWAGPFHWKYLQLMSTPATKSSGVRNYFRSLLNGWGECNLGKLEPGEEQQFVDHVAAQHKPIHQEVCTQPLDWPTEPAALAQKYLQQGHLFDSPVAGGMGPQGLPAPPPPPPVTPQQHQPAHVPPPHAAPPPH